MLARPFALVEDVPYVLEVFLKFSGVVDSMLADDVAQPGGHHLQQLLLDHLVVELLDRLLHLMVEVALRQQKDAEAAAQLRTIWRAHVDFAPHLAVPLKLCLSFDPIAP